MCFRCLIFIRTLWFIFALFYCLLDMRSGECDVVFLYVCVSLSMDLFVLCILTMFHQTIHNMFGCVCYFIVECDWRCSIGVFHRMYVLCLWSQWASRFSFHIICLCFLCRRLSSHFGVWEMDHMCLLSFCCFFVWFCILCSRVKACSCYASYHLLCCAGLPSVWCL